ncbi:pectinesterase family protein [Burkholderiaceae bacterium UC74_6]
MRAIALLLALCAAASAQAQRPQLDDAEAKRYGTADYLGDWQPQAITLDANKPDFIVGPGGTHRTVQAALDALPAKSDRRLRILVKPGTYRETVCVKDRAAFLLYGEEDAAKTVIVDGHYNAEAKAQGAPANPCEPVLNATTWGTYGSASFAVFSSDAQFANLTIANDAMDKVRDGQGYPAGVGEAGGAQAVAFMTKGDKIQLQNVRLVGHQDTFFVRGPGRVFVDRSFISGDVDFIFGNATLVIDRSTILSRYGRRAPGSGGYLLAPSTPAAAERGFLVTRSRLMGEPGLEPGSIRLGRAWDEGVPKGEWKTGSPNGQALVRDSELGPHLGTVGAGWGNSTSRRPYAASGPQANRFSEYRNAANIDREVLGPKNGWAAFEGGTRGGADAKPDHVFDVYKRSELVAAFSLGSTPKIIRIHGLIDFSRDEQGRHVVPASFADREYNFKEFLQAYDPETWGRKDPIGPLEGARKRSSKRQAEWMQLRVPSNTTLIGVGEGAGLNAGSLFLDGVDNIIIRRLRITDAYDFFPEWQPRDNGHGEWNSEYDAITLRGATHVWIDHCTFNDGDRPDQAEPLAFGQRIQHHDGLVDITRGSDLVTVSWNVFSQHDKTMLIGGSDSGKPYDDGHLRVTLHHNLWEQLMERTPRVRFGQVHVYNNLFVARADAAYGYHYSLGLGIESRIFSEANAWEASPGIGPEKLTRALKGTRLFDRGNNLLNGQPVDLLAGLRSANPGQGFSADVGWSPVLFEPMDSPEALASRVRAGAGVSGIGGQ